MECNFCKNTFKNTSSLTHHKKTALYCLKLRNDDDKKNIKIFKCDDCYKTFSTKNRLFTHQKICKKMSDKDHIKELNEQVKSLQKENELYKDLYEKETACVKEIAKQPRTTNSTTNNKLSMSNLNLNSDNVKTTVNDKLQYEHFSQGQKGMAKFTVDNLLTDNGGNLQYICSDVARQTCKYYDKNGDLQKDFRCSKLIDMISPELIKKSGDIADKKLRNNDDDMIEHCVRSNAIDINRIKNDEKNSDFRNEICTLTSQKQKGLKYKINTNDCKDKHLLPLTDDHLSNNIFCLTIEHIKKGIDGFVEYALEHPFKDRLLCEIKDYGDITQRKIKFINKKKELKTDVEMNNLCFRLFSKIQRHVNHLIRKYKDKLTREISEINDEYNKNDYSDYRKEVVDDANDEVDDEINKVMKQIIGIDYYRTEISNIVNCNESDFKEKFVEKICDKLIENCENSP